MSMLLPKRGKNAVLEKVMKRRPVHLLRIGQFAKRCEYFRRSGHPFPLSFPVKRQSRLGDLDEWELELPPLRITHQRDFGAFLAVKRKDLDFLFTPRQHAARYRCPTSDESAPIRSGFERPVRARRRNLQYILLLHSICKFQVLH